MLIPLRHSGYSRDGRRLYPLDIGGGDAPAPDPLIGQAAQMNAEVARDALAWVKAKDAADAPMRSQATKLALDQAAIQTDLGRQQLQVSKEERDRFVSTFRPIEQRIAAEAQAYDTPLRREAEAGQAMADVGSQIDAQREIAMREMASRGVDPSSGSAAVAMARMGIAGGAAQAAAGNQARKNVETVGSAKLADAAALGRGAMTNQATTAQLGINAGNSAVGNSQVPLNISAQQAAQMGAGFNTAIAGNQSAGGLMASQYSAQAQAAGQNNGVMGALGNVAGQFAGSAAGSKLIAGAFSDENMKEGVQPTSDEEALAAVASTPVKKWRYKKGTPADDGGQEHIGPMAQDVARTMGESTAPGGKVIDLVSANGITMKAVQAINKKVDRLAAAMGVPAAA